jgi:hypothetical protein
MKRATHFLRYGGADFTICGLSTKAPRLQCSIQAANVTCKHCRRHNISAIEREQQRTATVYVGGTDLPRTLPPADSRKAVAALLTPSGCQHDPFRTDVPTTVRVESHPFCGVRLRCRVCQDTAGLSRRSGFIMPMGKVERPAEAGEG